MASSTLSGARAPPDAAGAPPSPRGRTPAPAPSVPSPLPAGQGLSVVDSCGTYTSPCGYCGALGATSVSTGMWAHRLRPDTYQDLLEAGWRRSGCWLYRPDAARTCCTPHTIRLDATAFIASKEQRRCERRMAAYLAGGPLPCAGRGPRGASPPFVPPFAGGTPVPARRGSPLAGGSPAAQGAWGADAPPPRGASPDACPSPRPSPAAGARGSGVDAHVLAAALAVAGGARVEPGNGPVGGGPRLLSPNDAAPDRKRKARTAPAAALLRRAPSAGPSRAASGPLDVGSRVPSAAAAAVDASLAAALAALVVRGTVPTAARLPPPRAAAPTPAALRGLPPTLALSSPYGHVLAAAVRRAGGGRPTGGDGGGGGGRGAPDTSAATSPPTNDDGPARLAAALAAEAAASACLPAGWSAAGSGGHVNFFAPDAATARAEREAVGRGGGKRWSGAGPAAATAPPPPTAVSPAPPAAAVSPRPPSPPAPRPALGPRTLDVRTVPLPGDGDALVAAEFALYRAYQVGHHGETPSSVTEATFRRFLVDTPLLPVHSGSVGGGGWLPPGGLGTFHQQYWIDGRLAAVGVVDVLPRCLSAKYLFWDPALGGLGLGRWTALREIGWVRAAADSAAAAAVPLAHSLRWYFMGYYIHACPKMRYKAEFAPSELLCNRTLAWVPAAAAVSLLAADGRADISAALPQPPPPPPPPPRVLNTLLYLAPGRAPGVAGASAAAAVAGRSGGSGSGRGASADAEGGPRSPPPPPSSRPSAPSSAPASPTGGLVRLGALSAGAGPAPPMLAALADRLAPWCAALGPTAGERLVVLL